MNIHEGSQIPVYQPYTVLEGYDIYRSDNLIVALVVVKSQFGKDLRSYRWMKRNNQWKVDFTRPEEATGSAGKMITRAQ